MSEESAVKKRSRSKKVVAEDVVAVTGMSVSTEAPAKKTRTRKLAIKVAEEVEATATTSEAPKAKKTRETKKKAEDVVKPEKKAATASKRVAKKFSDEAQAGSESSSLSASKILGQARGFEAERREVNGSVDESSPAEGDVEHQIEVAVMHAKSHEPVSSSSKPVSSRETTSAQAIKPSSFLYSFFNDPEPAPVPPPKEHQERIDTPEASSVELQQATRHDFEDSVLTSRGKLKAASAPYPAPAAVIATMEPPAGALSSSQLRAFTTSSFAALKASSKAPTAIRKSPPTATQTPTSKTTAASSASSPRAPPKASTISTAPSSPTNASKPSPSTAPALSTATNPTAPEVPSEPQTSNSISKPPSTALKPPTTTTTKPSLPTEPLPSTLRRPPLFSQKPPQPPKPRPTAMTYAELKANAEYRSLKRRWTAVMVAVPFLVLTSYELWRRWEKGDFGGRDWRREGPTGDGIGGGEGVVDGVGGGVGGVGGKVDEFKSLHRGRTPVDPQKAPMVEGGGRVDGANVGQPVVEVQATSETFTEPTLGGAGDRPEVALGDVQQAGASKRGWIQVFK